MTCIEQLSDEDLDTMDDDELDEFLRSCAELQESDDAHYREPGTEWDEVSD